LYSPETGGRTFDENVQFFLDAKDHETWRVHKINNSEFAGMPKEKNDDDDEHQPLLSRDY
jgi:hypothetical protein